MQMDSAPPYRLQRLEHQKHGHASQQRDRQKHEFQLTEPEEVAGSSTISMPRRWRR